MSKYLVIGLGSMGKRRVRCLIALGVNASDIVGMDKRQDRCEEAQEKYGINIAENESVIDFTEINAVIVSLPPDIHGLGVEIAARHKKPVFVEASVMIEETKAIQITAKKTGIFVAPSCTMFFHPMLKEIKRIIDSQELGKVCNFSYHSGQYLPDWHPWEDIKDFYVSSRQTGGAREIVPYELTWITNFFGFPANAKGLFRKTVDLGCDIEDSYVCCLDYGNMVGSLLVDVVSRYPARNLLVNFQKGQIQWKWDREQIEIFEVVTGRTRYIKQSEQKHEEGYSSMVVEDMYVDEIKSFLNGITSPMNYPNNLERDIKVLSILQSIEESDGGF